VPDRPAHPAGEELASWQARALADPDSARVGAHLASCADCAAQVAAVERARAALAGLAEPEMPPGLHERLIAAVERELPALAGPAGHAAREAPGDAARRAAREAAGERREPGRAFRRAGPAHLDGQAARGRRARAWHRRLAALGAAAVVILLAVGLAVPLLHHAGAQSEAKRTSTAGGGATAAPGAPGMGGLSAAAPLPVFRVQGSYSPAALQASLAGDPAIRSAYGRAIVENARSSGAATSRPLAPGAQSDHGTSSKGTTGPAVKMPPGGLQQSTCVAMAQRQPGAAALRPAFFVTAVYRGRPATVLVTVRANAPDQADLWAFPRGDCSASPFAHDPVTVSPP